MSGGGIYDKGNVINISESARDYIAYGIIGQEASRVHIVSEQPKGPPPMYLRTKADETDGTFPCVSSMSSTAPMVCVRLGNGTSTSVVNGNTTCVADIQLPALPYAATANLVLAAQDAVLVFEDTPSALVLQHCAVMICDLQENHFCAPAWNYLPVTSIRLSANFSTSSLVSTVYPMVRPAEV